MTHRLLGPAALGLIAIVVSGCGGGGEAAPAPVPMPTPTPTTASVTVLATPAPGTPSTGGKGATLRLGDTAVLGPLRITVDRTERHTVAGTSRVGAHLKACVVKGYDAPAAFTIGAWSAQVDGKAVPAVSDGWDPVVTSEPDEPITGQLVEPGHCLSGFVTFEATDASRLASVRYLNRQGDAAAWRVGR